MKNKVVNLRNVSQNPCSMCMPLGGIIPFKGLEQSMVILHGSQGCSTYMRRFMAEHFNEPIDVGSSALNEKGTVYGGEENLKKGLDNILKVYNPKLIGILTTCLAETIGEDIDRISLEYLQEREMEDFPLVTVPTPAYSDSHTEGYFLAVKRIITRLAQKSEKNEKVNIIIPNISPADIREIKRILEGMEIAYTLLPDFSETMDAPFTNNFGKLPNGGTKLGDIRNMPGAKATIELGITVEDHLSPGKYLENSFGVPLYRLPLPIGLENTDKFILTLKTISGKEVPEMFRKERGRLQDCMIDSHKYNAQGIAVVFGEPELVYAVTKTCLENGIKPKVLATGSKNFKSGQLFGEESSNLKVLTETDFVHIRQVCKEMDVNLAIGNSEGKYLTEKEGIPLVRIGFPIHDRVGGQRILSVGYQGTIMFLDRITNTLLEYKLSNYRSSMYQKYFQGIDVK
ncbi:MAG: nitrogenase molybdenum-iron protein NifN [Clostridia bacterium]|nr:nitrogenase molybdenum-iron protein NifN [Clostridia bacterium]MDN5322447.1 nitrogenase molybdenum-iron protein NifN [Clostridia bacterium]